MPIYVQMFISGLSLGWGPCLAWCVPILTPYIAGTRNNFLGGIKGILFLSAGRFLAYIILGAICGFSGKVISLLFYIGNFSFYVKTAGGIFILFMGLSIVVGKNRYFGLCQLIKKYDNLSLFFLGILIGFSPCPPLLGILMYMILKCENIFQGSLCGASFGFGTLISPLIILAGVAGFVPKKIFKNEKIYLIFQKICGAIIIYMGFSLIFR